MNTDIKNPKYFVQEIASQKVLLRHDGKHLEVWISFPRPAGRWSYCVNQSIEDAKEISESEAKALKPGAFL